VLGVVFCGEIGVVSVVLGVVVLGVVVLGVVMLGVTFAGLVGVFDGVPPGSARPGVSVEGEACATVNVAFGATVVGVAVNAEFGATEACAIVKATLKDTLARVTSLALLEEGIAEATIEDLFF
jgi:hypothetical protein